MEPLGVVACGHEEGGRGVGSQTEELEQVWHRGHEQGFDPLVELGQLVVERADALWNQDSEALVAAVTVSGERLGRSPLPSATSAGTERPFKRQRSCSGAL